MATNQNGRGGLSSWLVRGLSRLLVLILAFVVGAVVMHVGMHSGDREHIKALQVQNTELQDHLTQSQAALAALTSQSNVQDGTQRTLQDKVTELQQALGNTRDQLSFYEQLLPAGPAGSVTVRAFDVQPEGDFLHYRVLLTRSAPDSSAPLKGRLRFVATGRQNGKTVQIPLSAPQSDGAPAAGAASADAAPANVATPAASDHAPAPAPAMASASSASPKTAPAAPVDPLALDFDQYQRSTGVLEKIPGLMIQSVRVDVLEGDTVRASQSAIPKAASAANPPTGASQ
ncbi:MAG TPA: DUF6776 family protein [Castellaniella sp.]|uniref:DUF6776 family protein n=1 Tax=Castellaniella sp. TaxID=1955812 RepID=UPI002EE904D6